MSIASWFGFGDKSADIIGAAGNALDELFTSDDERNAAKAVFEKLKQQPAALQVELNKIEAAHRSIVVAGWRPAIGWVCALSLALYFVPKFVFGSVVWVVTIHASHWLVIPPYPVDADGLFQLVFSLLGMAGLRTYEKAKGLTK